MDQETEPTQKPSVPAPDLSGPSTLSQPSLTKAPDLRPPDLSVPAVRAPDLPPPSIPAPTPVPAPSFAPPPSIPIPEEAKKKVKEPVPDPDEIKAGDIAPFSTRIIAGVIDLVVAMGLNIALAFVLPGILDKIAWLAAAAYLVTRDSLPFLEGQSIGKKAMKLRAVTWEGAPLTNNWQTGAIRGAVLLIPFFGLVELVILLTREEKPEKGRRLGDDFAKTKVIVVGDTVPVLPPDA